ncbi:MAG: hypothetical protein ACR2PS_09890 [Pseudomonadales bacterium]
MSGSVGPLLPADENFNHQIVETFASVAQSDPAWAEKVCGMAGARDGSLQIGFGFGKYSNRNVVDAYAAVSRGVEQWTVRASRALASAPESVSAGPIQYEIVEPLQAIRVRLEANESQPIAFDILFHAIVPCVLENREDRRDMHGYRRQTDQIRYHQTGSAEGWVEVNGVRTEVSADSWVATRDHSWGIRPSVGQPATDMEPDLHHLLDKTLAIWNPILFERPDGSQYAFHHYYLAYTGTGFNFDSVQGGAEYPDGSRELIIGMQPHLTFNPRNKRLQRGEFVFTMADGSERPLRFDALSDTGVHLGAGLYHGYEGQYNGMWRGPRNVEGDYYENCAAPAAVEKLNQFRDCMIRVEDPVGGGIGWGNCQTYVLGAWPDFGLTGEEPRF